MMSGDLTNEQQHYQFPERQEPTERSRTLHQYSGYLGMPIHWLQTTILLKARSFKGCTYADYGSGNAVALRQAKRLTDQKGLLSRLVTYGIDVLDPDEAKIKKLIAAYPRKFPKDLLAKKYEPHFIKEDIASVKLPEQPDISTLCEVLYYTRDPLRVIDNVLAQSAMGGLVGINGLSRIHMSSSPEPEKGNDIGHLLGPWLDSFKDKIPGFDTPYLQHNTIFGPDEIILVKQTSANTPEEINHLLNFDKYRLIQSQELNIQGGLEYYYWNEH